MKCSWWETKNIQDILLLLSQLIAGCLVFFKNDFWIIYSTIYIAIGAWVYHSTVENKNRDIEYLNHRINRLEGYAEQLEKKLENTRKN